MNVCVCVCVCVWDCLCNCLSACVSTCLSVCICICVSVCLPSCLSVCLPAWLSSCLVSVYQCCLPAPLPVRPSVYYLLSPSCTQLLEPDNLSQLFLGYDHQRYTSINSIPNNKSVPRALNLLSLVNQLVKLTQCVNIWRIDRRHQQPFTGDSRRVIIFQLSSKIQLYRAVIHLSVFWHPSVPAWTTEALPRCINSQLPQEYIIPFSRMLSVISVRWR